MAGPFVSIGFLGKTSRRRWVVQDQNSLCGAIFVKRAEAVRFAMYATRGHGRKITIRDCLSSTRGGPTKSRLDSLLKDDIAWMTSVAVGIRSREEEAVPHQHAQWAIPPFGAKEAEDLFNRVEFRQIAK